MSETAEERRAAREADQQRLRDALESIGFDGPHEFHSGDMLAAAFGGGSLTYAICLTCGAMVRLGDAQERDDGPPIERGIRLHVEWHSREA